MEKTEKQDLLDSIAGVPDADLVKSYVKLFIHMPTGEVETIINPNIREKAIYIDKAYDDDLHLKSFSAIYIEGYEVHVDYGNGKHLSFSEILEGMWTGKKARRAGWNGKGIFIQLHKPGEMTHPYIFIDTTGLKSDNTDAPRDRVPWVPSQTDMLSLDWEVVN